MRQSTTGQIRCCVTAWILAEESEFKWITEARAPAGGTDGHWIWLEIPSPATHLSERRTLQAADEVEIDKIDYLEIAERTSKKRGKDTPAHAGSSISTGPSAISPATANDMAMR